MLLLARCLHLRQVVERPVLLAHDGHGEADVGRVLRHVARPGGFHLAREVFHRRERDALALGRLRQDLQRADDLVLVRAEQLTTENLLQRRRRLLGHLGEHLVEDLAHLGLEVDSQDGVADAAVDVRDGLLEDVKDRSERRRRRPAFPNVTLERLGEQLFSLLHLVRRADELAVLVSDARTHRRHPAGDLLHVAVVEDVAAHDVRHLVHDRGGVGSLEQQDDLTAIGQGLGDALHGTGRADLAQRLAALA